MATNPNTNKTAQRGTVQCSCGKRLVVMPQQLGKLVRCPVCMQSVLVPSTPPTQPVTIAPQLENETEGMSKPALVGLWSAVGCFAFVCVLFVAWYLHSSHQARIADANNRISEAVTAANLWISGKSPHDGEAIEQQLTDALKDDVATEKQSGELVLSQVQRQREQLAQQARVIQAQQEATAIFDDAKRKTDGDHIAEAIALLRKYVSDPHATEKADAQHLLSEAEIAVSDLLTLNALVSMSDEEFNRAKAVGIINDGKVTQPMLLTVRQKTVVRNLDNAIQKRDEIKISEKKRQEQERLTAVEVERQRAEQKRLAEQRQKELDALEDKKYEMTVNEQRKAGRLFASAMLRWSGETKLEGQALRDYGFPICERAIKAVVSEKKKRQRLSLTDWEVEQIVVPILVSDNKPLLREFTARARFRESRNGKEWHELTLDQLRDQDKKILLLCANREIKAATDGALATLQATAELQNANGIIGDRQVFLLRTKCLILESIQVRKMKDDVKELTNEVLAEVASQLANGAKLANALDE